MWWKTLPAPSAPAACPRPIKFPISKSVLGVLVALATQAGLAAAAETSNYPRAAEPMVRPALVALPPGAVEPAGWLRDWALAARDGITGHLDERHATFRDGWKGIGINSTGAEAGGTGWPIEQCSYWLDGALRLGLVLHDEPLLKKIKARLDPIVDGVNGGSKSFIYWKKEMRPQGFNGWAHSHMGRALVAYYAATGEKRILDALVRVYSDYPSPMGALAFDDVSGLCNVDAMLETYGFSGDPRVLECAKAGIGSPAPEAAIRAWLEKRFKEGHAVVTYENLRLPALLYPWTGEKRLLQATLNTLSWIDERHMLPYGAPSGEEFMSGIGALRKTETCDVAAEIWTNAWMYRILGEGIYGDGLERVFFNAGPAPIARDFQTMSYYQSPNRIRSDSLPGPQPHAPGPAGNRFHALGCPNVLCCVGAVNRIIPNYVIHMWMATEDGGLAAALYGPSTVSAMVGPRVGIQVACQTAYPFEDSLRMTLNPDKSVEFPLYLRIPAWCKQAQITVNGTAADAKPDKKGFARLARTWSKGDVVELRFPMPVQVVHGYETEFPSAIRGYFNFEPDSVFVKRRLPYASVLRGPLLFALAIPDQDPNTPAADARWQFALDNAAEGNGADITVESKAMPAKWDWPLDAPVAMKVPAQAFDWKPTDAQALPDAPVAGKGSETLRLVPYGCTKFRISMFPVTNKAWGRQP